MKALLDDGEGGRKSKNISQWNGNKSREGERILTTFGPDPISPVRNEVVGRQRTSRDRRKRDTLREIGGGTGGENWQLAEAPGKG